MSGNPHRFRPLAGAACLMLAPALNTLGLAFAPWESEPGDRNMLAAMQAAPDRAQLSALLLHYGWLLLVPGLIVMIRAVRGRGVILATLGGALAVTGAIGISGMLLVDFFGLGAVQTIGLDHGTKVYQNLGELWGFHVVAVPAFLGVLVGIPLLALGVVRAGIAPYWIVLALVAGYIGGNLAGNSRAAQVAASVALVLAYGRVSVAFLERQKKSDRARCRTSTGR
jgi:hypothetical protein